MNRSEGITLVIIILCTWYVFAWAIMTMADVHSEIRSEIYPDRGYYETAQEGYDYCWFDPTDKVREFERCWTTVTLQSPDHDALLVERNLASTQR